MFQLIKIIAVLGLGLVPYGTIDIMNDALSLLATIAVVDF